MNDATDERAATRADVRDFRRLAALVVDGSAAHRRKMRRLLARWDFEVLEAADGASALEICRHGEVDFVICDWTIPDMSGPTLCRTLRGLPLARDVYVIVLTAGSDREAVTAGLEAGADDFLAKPPDAARLHARLRVGQRILAMQEDLADKSRRITEAVDRLGALAEEVGRDIRAAVRLQRALVPPRQSRCGPVGIGALWRSAGQLGGDLVGYFPVSPGRIAAYSIDVAGHGVPAALLTARLAYLLAPGNPRESPAIRRLGTGALAPLDPAELAAELNGRMQDEAGCDHFTMLLADVDIATGLVRFCQAGHPGPAILRRDGAVEFAGDGGAPVGLWPDMVWETGIVQLDPGERLVMFSDGIAGCANPSGDLFETAELARVISRTRGLPEADQLDGVLEAMAAFAGTGHFEDDLSALILTMP